MKFSATRRSARRSTPARSTPRASRASPASRARIRATSRKGGFGPGTHFETFSWGPGAASRAARGAAAAARCGRLGGGIDDILKDVMGGMGGAAAARASSAAGRSNSDDEGPVTGQDIRAQLTVTLSDLTGNAARKRVRLPTGKEVDVRIPPGIDDGQTIRLKGQGFSGPDGTGDVLITVHVAHHPLFERDGADLRLDLPVTLYEAVLGGKVRVPTLDGAVELAIPPHTNGGRTFRLKGKGLPGKDGTGDLYAPIRIVLPHDPDPRSRRADAQRWRDEEALRSARQGSLIRPSLAPTSSAERHSRRSLRSARSKDGWPRLRRMPHALGDNEARYDRALTPAVRRWSARVAGRTVFHLLVGRAAPSPSAAACRPARSPHSRSRPRPSGSRRIAHWRCSAAPRAIEIQLRAIEREALAAAALVHEQCRRAVHAGQQPPAKQRQVEGGRDRARARACRAGATATAADALPPRRPRSGGALRRYRACARRARHWRALEARSAPRPTRRCAPSSRRRRRPNRMIRRRSPRPPRPCASAARRLRITFVDLQGAREPSRWPPRRNARGSSSACARHAATSAASSGCVASQASTASCRSAGNSPSTKAWSSSWVTGVLSIGHRRHLLISRGAAPGARRRDRP